jgi:hypothetical protein
MSSLFSGPVHPPSVPMPPPAAHPATLGSSTVALQGQSANKAGAAAEGMGFDDTIKTAPGGLTQKASTATTTLLGG